MHRMTNRTPQWPYMTFHRDIQIDIIDTNLLLHHKFQPDKKGSGGHSNLKMLSKQQRDSHYKDKMVSRSSYLYNGNSIPGKDCLYIEIGPCYPQGC